ncbi:ABC transporter substrate-binding protein [Micromonospora sp. NPDC048830]|uniref:ABC transporter substrate-binding protein n=1 Tax=Micromonospora sp. NPDC048830 TaxID=3364257 RepID=UPI00371AB839
MLQFKKIAASAAVGILALTTAACGSGSEPETGVNGMTVVKLRHSWIPDDVALPIMVAKEKGFYREEKIDLQDQVGDGSATAAKLVANGDVLIGTGEASTVISSRSNGMDLVNIGTQFQRNSTVLASMKQSGIKDWSDLKGKKISISFTSSTYAAMLAAFKNKRVNPDAVRFVNLPPGADLKSLPSGEIDVACVFVANLAPLEYKDDLNTLSFADAGVGWPSTGYFVRADTVKKNKELLIRWMRATLKGLQYTLDHPDEAGQLMAKAYPDVKADMIVARWKLSEPYVKAANGSLGTQDLDAWQAEEADLLSAKVTKRHVDVSEAVTNEIVDAAMSGK